ncbi:MAG: hypothetical protein KC549_04480 [Myxococcales bacterium]|nr:hypothetical protein [Myxococcales bacterium]
MASPTDASEPYLMTVVFDETHGSLIEEFATRVSDVTDPWYGCYMAREELEAYVRPSVEAVKAVDAWLGLHGITPAGVSVNTQVRFYYASAEQIKSAFGQRAATWLNPEVETRAHRREWPVPREIAGLVQQVQVIRGGDQSLEWLEGTHWLQKEAHGLVASTGGKPEGLSGLSPATIADIYDVPTGPTGSGETIAVLMLSHAPSPEEVAEFCVCQGISRVDASGTPTRLEIVPIGPQPDAEEAGLGALESAMVSQWACAMAPGAQVVVYVVDERTVADPWSAFLLAVIGDKRHRPTVAVTTWLLPERSYYNAHGAGVITGLLNQCAALGITVLSATGDWGCFDSFPRTRDSDSHTVADAPWPHAVFPAVEDRVLAVGGTMVTQVEPLTEQAWSGPLPISLYGRLAFTTFAGGGGFSMEVPIPEWQRPFLLRKPNYLDKRAYSRGPDVPAVLAYGRGLPDVALASTSRAVLTQIPPDQQAGRTEDLTTEGYQALVQGTWIDYAGGTSMAAPVWAAFIARLNEARAAVAVPERATLEPALRRRMAELATAPEVDPERTTWIPPEVLPDDHPGLRRPLGFANPLLYRVQFEDTQVTHAQQPPAAPARAFRDIVAGNTDVTVRTLQRNHSGDFKAFMRRIPGFEADEGWDPVTGLGVPRLAILLERVTRPAFLGLTRAEPMDMRGELALLDAFKTPTSK